MRLFADRAVEFAVKLSPKLTLVPSVCEPTSRTAVLSCFPPQLVERPNFGLDEHREISVTGRGIPSN